MSALAAAKKQVIGQWLEAGGAVAFACGVVLSLHHAAIVACLAGGAAAYAVGRKLRAA
jgi:hypothetical protein